jgi:hypothetical protein
MYNMSVLLLTPPYHKCLQSLLSHIGKTRGTFLHSCYTWQLYFHIMSQYVQIVYRTNMASLCERSTFNHLSYSDMETIERIRRHCISEHKRLQTFISYNSPKDVTPIVRLADLPLQEHVIYKLCFYIPTRPNVFVPKHGTIIHYFSVFIHQAHFYITSSYGSSFVCIPPYTTQVNSPKLFDEFCQFIRKPVKDRTRRETISIETFVKEHFLQNGIDIPEKVAIEEDDESQAAVPAAVGMELEANVYTQSEIYVGWMATYDELVQESIDAILQVHDATVAKKGVRRSRKLKSIKSKSIKSKSRKLHRKSKNKKRKYSRK